VRCPWKAHPSSAPPVSASFFENNSYLTIYTHPISAAAPAAPVVDVDPYSSKSLKIG